MLHLVLYQPRIPHNTGAIARQCVGMNARLHLIHPLGFQLDDRNLRRAALDYWPHLDLQQHQSPDAFLRWLETRQPWLVTKFGQTRYDHAPFADHDILILGDENRGLPNDWLTQWRNRTIHIPQSNNIRSYNLANAAAIILAQASATAGLYDQHP